MIELQIGYPPGFLLCEHKHPQEQVIATDKHMSSYILQTIQRSQQQAQSSASVVYLRDHEGLSVNLVNVVV